MTNICSCINWQIMLLICPLVVGIVIFAYLLWCDILRGRKDDKKGLTN